MLTELLQIGNERGKIKVTQLYINQIFPFLLVAFCHSFHEVFHFPGLWKEKYRLHVNGTHLQLIYRSFL